MAASVIERRCVFFLPIQDADEYRRISASRIWRHESKLRDEDETGSSKYKTEIADSVISQLFGFTRSFATKDTALLETCDGGPVWSFTVDLNTCPYTRKSLEAACQVLLDMLTNCEDFFADDPRAVNRSGNPDYYDPVTIYADFDVPEQVRKILKRRKVQRR